MRRPRWFDVGEESLARRLALLPLDLLALVYGVGACAHRTAYTRGLFKPVQLSCRVVSVGNLVVGGSGKTPMAAWLAKVLHQRGHRVVLASRGYARRGRERVEVVSDGRFVSSTAEVAGDEPILLAAHAPGVPVLVGPDRDVVGMRAVSAFGAQILVLDDGFHHHRLARVRAALDLGQVFTLPRHRTTAPSGQEPGYATARLRGPLPGKNDRD